MSTTIEPSLTELRALARDFAAAELRPHTEGWDHAGAFAPGVLAELAELGFLGMLVPEDDGGLGFGLPQYVAVLEELAWGEPGVALAVAESTLVSALVAAGATGGARERWLGALAGGELPGTRALAEADGASAEPTTGQARATTAGAGWRLTGEKAFVPAAATAGVFAVLAGSGEPGEAGLFLVPADTAGVTAGPATDTLGLRTVGLAPLALADVDVGRDHLLGEAQDGHALLERVRPTARLAYAAVALGIAAAALEHAVAYAAEREQFGRALRGFEGIQFKLADMAAAVDAARAHVLAAAAAPEGGAADRAKLTAAGAATAVVTEAVQIFGGYGYMRDYPVEKLMRDASAMGVLEGSNEILRVAIARGLYD